VSHRESRIDVSCCTYKDLLAVPRGPSRTIRIVRHLVHAQEHKLSTETRVRTRKPLTTLLISLPKDALNHKNARLRLQGAIQDTDRGSYLRLGLTAGGGFGSAVRCNWMKVRSPFHWESCQGLPRLRTGSSFSFVTSRNSLLSGGGCGNTR
jgi:hypothetical protein